MPWWVMISVGLCVVCPSSIYGFSLPFWYFQAPLVLNIENKIALHTTDLMDDLGIKNKNVDINFSAQSMLRV